jgi:hypothetical protein
LDDDDGVMPAKAGIQAGGESRKALDSGFPPE